MSSKAPVFSQVVANARVGRGPVMGANGAPIEGSHRGVDLAVASGTSVSPVASGTVVFSGPRSSDYGNVVVVRHDLPDGKAVYTLYGHMESKPAVSVGDVVSPSTTLGQSGSTGRSTGPHVHFEMVEALPGQASPVDKDGALGGYFSYKLLDPKTNPYGMLDWNPAQISRNDLTPSERLGQLKLSDTEFSTYKDQLASIETKGKSLDESYLTTSKSGEYLGRYQIGKSSGLIEAGYMDKAGNWTDYAKSQGVSSAQDFLNNPAAQDDALRNLTNKNAEFVVRNDLDLRIGDTVGDTQLTGAGLLLGSHNSRGNLKNFVESDGTVDKGDGNGFQVSNFVEAGNKVTTAGAPATTQTSGHFEDRTYYDPMSGLPVGGENRVWVPDVSTVTSKPTTSTDTRTPYPSNSKTTHHKGPDGEDEGITVNYIAKNDSVDGSIAKGDTVTYVQEDGITTYFSIRHTVGNETTVTERSADPVTGEVINGKSVWVGKGSDTLQFSEQRDAQGNLVGDAYVVGGVRFTRTPEATDASQWIDLSGRTQIERQTHGEGEYGSDAHIIRYKNTDPKVASLDPASGDQNTEYDGPSDKVFVAFQSGADGQSFTRTPALFVPPRADGYTAGPDGTLRRPVDGHSGLFEVRNSDGSGAIIDFDNPGILAMLQPGDYVRAGRGDPLTVYDDNGQVVDRTTEAGRTGVFVVPDSSGASPALAGSDAHFNNHPPATEPQSEPAAQPTTQDITDAANQQLIDAFGKPGVYSNANDVQTADASSVIGTGTVSGVGTGITVSTDYVSASNQPVAVEPEQPATNTVATTTEPTPQPFVQYGSNYNATLQPYASALSLVSTLSGLKNWDHMNDVGHLNTVVSLASNFNTLTDGSLGNLGGVTQFAGYVNLAQSIQNGDTLGTLSGINSISDSVIDSSLNSALGSSGIPYVGIVMALNDFEHHPLQSIGALVGMYFGPVGSMIGSLVGGLLDGMMGGNAIPPPPDGAVHYTWNEAGAITIQTDHDISEGAATATSTAGSVLSLLQSVVSNHNDDNDAKGNSSNNLGIDPSRMPRIGFTAGMSWLEITHADGTTTKETINPDTIGERLLQIAVDNDALAPQWQIQTAQAHAKAAQAAQAEAQAQATTTDEPVPESASAIDGQTPAAAPTATTSTVHNTAAVFGLEGTVQEASDHKTQTFAALVVHLHSPGAQDAVAAIGNTPVTATNTVLQDVDGDGFWEQTQWVASKDDAGNAQGMLVLDHNNNRLIEAADILHLGGNSNERNSLAWLDSNNDGKLDASDPAFAAIKVFVDINNDGQVNDGEMQTPQLSSIDFTTGQINYTEGPSASLTATTLSGDTEGIKLDTIKVVDEDGKLQELKVGSVLVHEGYQGQVRVNSKGEIVADDDPATDNRWVAQRINSYEFDAAHLSDWEGTDEQDQHRHGGGNVDGAPTETTVTGASSIGAVLGKDNVKTFTTMEQGDARIVSDAPGHATTGGTTTKPTANTTITLNAGDARIRSLTPAENAQRVVERVVFVPSGVRDGWMTADGKELLQLPDDGLFGAGGMAGALMAVALGAVQSTAFAKADADDTGFTWQTTPLMTDGAGANSNNLNFNTDAANVGSASAFTISAGNYATTVHRVRLGVRLSAAPLADASAASYTLADTAALRTSNTQTPTSATHYASANLVAADANTGPTQTLIDNQLKPKAKTPTDSTTTPPVDPALDAGSTAPSSPTTSTTTPATPPSTTPAPPSPTLVATPPTAPAAVTPTPGNDQLSNNPLEDTALHVSFATLMANDLNASSITAVGNATHGSVAIVGGEVVFTPSLNYHGPASFVYQVVSLDGNFALGQADFDISGVNDVPVVLGESANANEDVALVLSQTTLLANDTDVDVATDGQTLSVSAVGNASHGTVSILGNGSVQFNPDANFHGTASFKYVVSDGHGGSATATATVQVAAVNDVPVALGEVIAGAEDTTLLVSQAALLVNDTDADVATDGQTLSINAVSNASNGMVSLLGSGQIQFIPTANYTGSASFEYVVSDGHGGTATATATVLVGSTDDAPVASGETVNSQEDQMVTLTAAALLANETDIDNAVSSLSISRVTGGSGGSAVLNASGNVVFTPNANFSGTASFTYWVKDPDGMESNPATVTLNVAAVNDAPYAQGEVLSGASEDAVFNIDRSTLLGNDGDEEDSWSQLSIELVGGASSGTVAMGAGGNVVFTPTANFNGNVSFQYQVRDTSGALSPAVTAQFNVAAVNDNPVGVDETLTPMYTNTATSPSTATIGFTTLLTNDSDVDNPASDLTVSGVRNASNGTVSIVAGAVSFTPTLDFNGTASFEYQVNDQYGGQTWATAFISVAPPPNLYPSINVTYFNFYPTGTTPAGAWDVGNLNWSIADDGNTGLVSVTYLSGSYHVFGDPGAGMGSLPWNAFATTQTSWYVDVPRAYAVDSFTTTWRVVDDRGLENTWHLNYTVGSGYQSVMDFTGYAPPVVLGLHGDSPHYIETRYSNVRFDLNGDGIADQVAWAAPGSGVLGIDLNGDQRISNANEFSFTQYVPGAKTDLQGLHAFDTNDNGVLDAGDAQWAQFGVWEDKNSDGVTQDGEYQTLDALGIANINLNGHTPTQAQDKPADGHLTGVAVVGESTFTRTDGSTGQVDDAMLAFGVAPMVAPYSHEAEVMRMALLFNQMCNTASDGDHAALGFVPIQADHHWQDAVVAMPQSAWQETQPT